ncbi:Thiamine pyrophosphokinase [bioreactor metagenome]|uniref:Thiamine pyrophosphokinase n=1 Tax=bioreactor metagenome TaxID=1076179 RepID=A0A645AMX8_9ZZZZ
MCKRALLFANGELTTASWLTQFIAAKDFLIAVDGGLRHLLPLGRIPHLLIGDLDSVEPAQVEQLKAQGVEIRQYPVHKDETDLELALLAAAKMGFQELVVIGALGGRLDQTLANLSLLLLPELKELSVRLEDGSQEVFVFRTSTTLNGHPGDIVSLIPLWGAATGVLTEGLAYPLHNETLYPERSRGISNVMQANQARVSLSSGLLLCIHELTQK